MNLENMDKEKSLDINTEDLNLILGEIKSRELELKRFLEDMEALDKNRLPGDEKKIQEMRLQYKTLQVRLNSLQQQKAILEQQIGDLERQLTTLMRDIETEEYKVKGDMKRQEMRKTVADELEKLQEKRIKIKAENNVRQGSEGSR